MALGQVATGGHRVDGVHEMKASAVAAMPANQTEQDAFYKRAEQGSSASRGPLPFFIAAGIWEAYTAPGYIVKRIAEPKAITSIFGDQGTYKSAIAVALVGSVSTGLPFYGAKVRKAGCLYVAGEGCGGMRKRLRAWMMAHDMTSANPQPPIAVTEAPASLIGNSEQLIATILETEKQLSTPIELVVFDTLAANFGEGEENSATDMSLAIANARRAAPAAALVVIHHTGHNGDRERGSSSFPFGADFRFRAIYDKESRTVEFRNLKQKDDELQPSIFFAPRRFGVDWLDADDAELTAVVLDRVEQPETEATEPRTRTGASGLGANQESVMKVLRRLYRIHRANVQAQGRDPNQATVLLSGLRNSVVDEKIMSRQRYGEALEGLKERGLVLIEGPHIRILEAQK